METVKGLAEEEGHTSSKDPARDSIWSASTTANCRSSAAIYPGTEADPKAPGEEINTARHVGTRKPSPRHSGSRLG